jgi:eukaryotic-like serine/threonine-protein kinase
MQSAGQRREFCTLRPVEGELLSDRLKRAPLSAGELFRFAIDIGCCLHDAHVRNTIHGRISPSAVLITAGGARLLCPEDSTGPDLAAYRAPEQVRGACADERSDIFAYGTLVYEMAGCGKAFPGASDSVDREILESHPAGLDCPLAVRDAIFPVVASCLEKDPDARRQRIQTAVLELRLRRPKRAQESPVPKPVRKPAARSRSHRGRILTVPVGLIVVGGLAAAIYFSGRPAAAPKVRPPTPESDQLSYGGAPAVSPDGRSVVFPAPGPDGRRVLWIRRLDRARSFPLPGTEDGVEPFWSPDGQAIGFFSDGELKRTGSEGGEPATICQASRTPGGGAWGANGTILFAPGRNGGLFAVSSSGGTAEPVLPPDPAKSEMAYLWPQFLPGDSRFIFFGLTTEPRTTGIYAGSRGSPARTFILAAQTGAVYAADTAGAGHLLLIRGRDLIAQPFDPAKARISGTPAVVASDVGAVWSFSLAPVSVSKTGTLVYQPLGRPTRRLAWVGRNGNLLASSGETGEWGQPNVSPAGDRAIVAKLDPVLGASTAWIVDASGASRRLLSAPVGEQSAVWSPDGRRVAATLSDPAGTRWDLYVRRAEGIGESALLFRDTRAIQPTGWSRDGAYVLFTRDGRAMPSEVWGYSFAARTARPIVSTAAPATHGALSPDSRWLAFELDGSGTPSVWVQPFSGFETSVHKRFCVAAGAALPRWKGDGTEIYYMDLSGRLMAVTVQPRGTELTFDAPRPLFRFQSAPQTWNVYDVSPDGGRFLVNLPLEWSASSAISVVTGWNRRLKR